MQMVAPSSLSCVQAFGDLVLFIALLICVQVIAIFDDESFSLSLNDLKLRGSVFCSV